MKRQYFNDFRFWDARIPFPIQTVVIESTNQRTRDLGRKANVPTYVEGNPVTCTCCYMMLIPSSYILYDFLRPVKVAPHECVIRTCQP